MAEQNNGGAGAGGAGGDGGAGDKIRNLEKIEVPKADWENLTKAVNQLKQENSDIVQELAAKKKHLTELADKEKLAKDQALADQGKFKELADARGAEIEALRKDKDATLIDIELREAARKEGLQDLDLLKLIDRSGVKIEEGKIVGIEEAVKNFKKNKPSFFGKARAGGGLGQNNADADRFGGIDPRSLTPAEVAALPKEERRKVIEALRPSNAPRSGSAFTRAAAAAGSKQ